MNCEDLVRYLSDYIDNELDDELTREARAHLSTCHNCRVVLDSTQQTILLFREHGQQQTISTTRRQDLFRALEDAFSSPPESDADADEDT